MTGKIVRLTDRGFGFITPDEGGKDLFFHARSLQEGVTFDSLKEGQAVTYEVQDGEKGPSAVSVALA